MIRVPIFTLTWQIASRQIWRKSVASIWRI